MDTIRSENTGFILPPARDLLRSSVEEDKMVVDEPYERKGPHQDLPSMQTNDDYIRHRMSDMSVSPHKVLSPLEPNTHQQFYARENTNNSYHNYRRPSITDMNNLPLPNSTVISRRGSIATEYEYPSRSPSPSPFTFPSKRGYDDYGRRDSLPINQPPSITPHPLYDPYQRRHSIATAESNTPRNNAKYRGFRFPATIQESPSFGTYSAPPSPPQSALSNVGYHQEIMHETNTHRYQQQQQRLNVNRRKYTEDSGSSGSIPSMDQLLVRRASMPAVTLKNNIRQSLSRRGSVASDEEKRKESPYSRSPELRVSHKLAERKRRKEMKELFDELRDSLPVEKNMKTTVEYISLLKRRDYDLENEVSDLRREIDMIKRERGPRVENNKKRILSHIFSSQDYTDGLIVGCSLKFWLRRISGVNYSSVSAS
ncbi:hypothetical protein MFLAVUS_004449 [Mucor flavus]|uniref:BHLH domain-containing protein n=1 Tax=Mucor flavus TaxID=439312 RepID=A0ABP9YVY8_9FUNG